MTERKLSRVQANLVLGILISLVAIALLISFIDGEQVLVAIKQIRLIFLLPGFVLLIISHFTRAAAARVILKERVSLWQSFLLINAGYFVNTVLPFRLGELSRAFLLMPSGLSFWEALPTILLERMFDAFFALSLFFIALPYVLNFSQGVYYTYLLAGLLLVGIVFLALVVKNRVHISAWLESKNASASHFLSKIIHILQSVLSSLAVLADPLRLVKVITWMFFSWGIALGFQYLLLKAFIPDAKLIWAMFALGAVALGVSVPSSPGNIGLYEASMTLALLAFGIDQSLAFTYALTSHIFTLAITTLFGSFGLVRSGYGLRDVWQFSKQHREENGL
ncbi:MAG: flippase-like domain-containing protein [Anaerolineales bacterium]|nr:MAG: flippase-like domain-containing protein [Anaerolineales bacterium]